MKKIALFSALALCLAGFVSCVEDKVYDVASISDIKNTVAYTEEDAVTVTAKVTALVEITKVELKYKTGSAAENTVAMTGSKNEYSGTIPAAPLGTKVTYRIEASTDGSTMSSPEVSYTVGEVPIDYTGLALNEINGNDKFIEIYNKGNEEIRIKGISIQKDGKDVWTAPSAILKPGEFILLYSGTDEQVKADHPDYPEEYLFNSGLSAKKVVKVELFDPKGNSLDCFNLVNVVKKASASYSRVPDGTGDWYFTSATPSAKNANETSDKVEGLE